MTDSVKPKPPSSPRAAASIIFACFSLFAWRIYGHLHWVIQKRSVLGSFSSPEFLHLADQELVIAYLTLAALAAIWCIWSWLTESRMAAIIATVFAALAAGVVSTMGMHASP